jgi:tetratricopeptide (TPR) repeat protein
VRCVVLILLIPVTTPPGAAAPTQEIAQAIYGRLTHVAGDARRPPPLEVIPDTRRSNEKRVAWFDVNARKIGIDEKTVRLCQSLGSRTDGCVAFFLGHELAHFYKDHAWGADFGSRFSATPLGTRIQKLSAEQRLSFETQADEFGGIFGYLAGYDTLGAAHDALDRVYKEYSIPDTSPDYPSVAERQQIAIKSQAALNRFIPVFEAGNLLFNIGRYRDAATCFDSIAQTFPSREILNNAGIAQALASGAVNADWYPWVLDPEPRLSAAAGRRRSPDVPSPSERQQMLEAAWAYFEDASHRDPEYFPAVLNMSLVNDLLGRYGTAADTAGRALDLAAKAGSEAGSRAAHLSRAIALIHDGDPQKANADLTASGSDPGVVFWKAVAAKQPLPARPAEPPEKPGPDESIAGRRAMAANPTAQSIPVAPGLRVWSNRLASLLELHVVTAGGHLRALITRDYDKPTARGIARGTPVKAVREAYGEPSRIHQTTGGEWFVYDRAGLLIRFTPAETVGGWTIYAWRE